MIIGCFGAILKTKWAILSGFVAFLQLKMATKPLKIALFVLRIARKPQIITGQDWYQIEALFFYFPTHPANPRGNGRYLVKNAKEKGSKMEKSGPGRTESGRIWPDLANEKKVRTLYYINFLSRIQPRIQKYQKPVKKALKNAISDFPHFHPVFEAPRGPLFEGPFVATCKGSGPKKFF